MNTLTPTCKVYHAAKAILWPHIELHWPHDYHLVAEVLTDDIEEAYYLTQHIDSEWWSHPRVTPTEPTNHRSTMPGDVVVDPKGTAWRCQPLGWSKILPDQP